jgi:hypothetical protein
MSYAPQLGTVKVEVLRAVSCDRCDDDGLVEDEQWSPEWPGQQREFGPPYYGLMRCGWCDGDKWGWEEVDLDRFIDWLEDVSETTDATPFFEMRRMLPGGQ